MAQSFNASVYELNGNPMNGQPHNWAFGSGQVTTVRPYMGPNYPYLCYSQITTSDGEVYGCSELVSTIITRMNT